MLSKTLTGSHLKLYLNGDYLGIVTGGEIRVNSPLKAARAVDSSLVYELMPTVVDVLGTVSVVRLHGTGGLEGAGVAVFPEELLLQKYLTFDFVDRRTSRVVYHIEQVLTNGQRWSLASKALVVGSFGFQGTTWSNEVAS